MSYSNPTRDTHGHPLNTDRRYRLYCGDGHNYLADIAEGEDGELLVRIGLTAGWGRYDEMQVERVVPVDQYGADIAAPEDSDAGAPSVGLLQADLDELANLRSRMERIVRSSAARLGLSVDGGFLNEDLGDDFGTMMLSGESSAQAILDWIDVRVPAITRVVAKTVSETPPARAGRRSETSAA